MKNTRERERGESEGINEYLTASSLQKIIIIIIKIIYSSYILLNIHLKPENQKCLLLLLFLITKLCLNYF
jgi:uncharacterized membrane protein YqjE